MSAIPGLTPPKPIPIKDRSSLVFVQKGQVDVIDGTFVVVDGDGVRTLYKSFARDYGARWDGRIYDPDDFESGDLANRCLSSATACLHALAEAAILAAGYAPAIGFLHTGKARAFAYDIADIFKFETVVPVAFRVTGAVQNNRPIDRRPVGEPTRAVRLLVRDSFRKTRLLEKLIPTIEDVLAAGGLTPPDAPPEAQPPAIAEPPSGDIGHRG